MELLSDYINKQVFLAVTLCPLISFCWPERRILASIETVVFSSYGTFAGLKGLKAFGSQPHNLL